MIIDSALPLGRTLLHFIVHVDGFWRGTKLVDLKSISDKAMQICSERYNIQPSVNTLCSPCNSRPNPHWFCKTIVNIVNIPAGVTIVQSKLNLPKHLISIVASYVVASNVQTCKLII